MRREALFFDLDGTLLNTLADLSGAMNHALEQLSMPTHSVEACSMMIGNGVPIFAKRALPPDRQDLRDELVSIMRSYYFEHSMDKTYVYEGLVPVLKSLKESGVRMAVLTNKEQIHAERVIDHYFAAGTFEHIAGAQEGMAAKPDPAGTLRLLDRMELRPGQCALIGDTEVDIQTAHNAGMTAVGVTWGFRDRGQLLQSKPDIIIGTPSEILNLLT